MVLFNNIPYKRMCLTCKVNLTKCFSEKYKRMRLITRLYGKHSKPSTARNFFSCSHSRYAKYLIVGLSLYKNNCMMDRGQV